MAVIRIDRLQKLYGEVLAVSDVSLEVESGEVLGLLGPSGCGKTTTLRCVAGLETTSGGTIQLGGKVMDSPSVRVPAERRGVGMVFQSYALWPHMTVAKNVEFPLGYVDSVTKSQRPAKVKAALDAVGLDGYAARYPGELSGGQQQRVAVARAIASEPAVLLFDEPLSNLDAKLRNRVRLELKVLLRRLDATALYVTHDQKEAMALCDRIAVMSNGVVRQIGTPEEVYEHPADTFVAAFVGDTNIVPFDPVGTVGSGSRVGVLLGGRRFLVEQGQVPGDGSRGGYAVLRPEDLSLNRTIEDADGWQGAVAEKLYLGSYVQYLVTLDGTDVQLTVDERGSFDVGDRCFVTPRMDRVVWLEHDQAEDLPETGQPVPGPEAELSREPRSGSTSGAESDGPRRLDHAVGGEAR